MKTIRDAQFVPAWIDMTPQVPEPRIDWIEEKYLDLAYGEDPLQRLDLYLPPHAEKPLPLVVLVHGGGFCLCDKRDWHLYPGFYALREGFALASVNYRLAPAARFPAPVEDLKTALRFLRAQAGRYGLRTQDVFLYWTSAGGNLVTLAGLQNAGTPEAVAGVAALCPLLDFENQWAYVQAMEGEAAVREMFLASAVQYLGAAPSEDAPLARRAGAREYITPKAPPFYLQHGTLDPAVPVEQAREFAAQLRAVCGGGAVTLDLMEGVAHAGGGPEFLEEEHILPILGFFRALCRETPQKGEDC